VNPATPAHIEENTRPIALVTEPVPSAFGHDHVLRVDTFGSGPALGLNPPFFFFRNLDH
jgi:hypothetical protein